MAYEKNMADANSFQTGLVDTQAKTACFAAIFIIFCLLNRVGDWGYKQSDVTRNPSIGLGIKFIPYYNDTLSCI